MHRFIALVALLSIPLLTSCGGPETARNSGDASYAVVPPSASSATPRPSAAVDSAPIETAPSATPTADPERVPPSARASASKPSSGAPSPDAPTSSVRTPDPDAMEPVASQTPAAEPNPGEAEAILRRAEAAYADLTSLEADFVQQVSVPLLNQSQTSRGKIYSRPPDRFLMKFTDPAGDIVVADGTYLWLYYPSSDPKQVIRGTLASGGRQVDLQREFLSNPTARFNVTLRGEEPVAGREAYVLDLVPKQDSQYRKVRLWIDERDALVRRFEITEENESVRRLDLSALETDVSLPDELFHFTPPPGAQVFNQ